MPHIVVQIVDDDKAVHIVAAINLYEAVPECSLRGIDICVELAAKQVGCAIGMAYGPTFCGVTGCATIACRWDITGPPAVRAARLMQFAVMEKNHVAIDHSIYSTPGASTRLKLLQGEVSLKGTETFVPVYTLTESTMVAAFRILDTLYGKVSIVGEVAPVDLTPQSDQEGLTTTLFVRLLIMFNRSIDVPFSLQGRIDLGKQSLLNKLRGLVV